MIETQEPLVDVRFLIREYGTPRTPEGTKVRINYEESFDGEIEKQENDIEVIKDLVSMQLEWAADLGLEALVANRLKDTIARTHFLPMKTFEKHNVEGGQCSAGINPYKGQLFLAKKMHSKLTPKEKIRLNHEMVHKSAYKQVGLHRSPSQTLYNPVEERAGYKTPTSSFKALNEALTEISNHAMIVKYAHKYKNLADLEVLTGIGYKHECYIIDKIISKVAAIRNVSYMDQLKELQIGMLTGDLKALKVLYDILGKKQFKVLSSANICLSEEEAEAKALSLDLKGLADDIMMGDLRKPNFAKPEKEQKLPTVKFKRDIKS